jgi:signal peptidase I
MENLENLPTESNPETPTAQPPEARPSHAVLDVIETLLLALVLFLGMNLITARIRVEGPSMKPTLHNGEYVLVNRLAYKWAQPHQGEVIVFRFPRKPSQEYIKRVIGLPGDEVYITNKQVFINGHLVEEPYIAEAPQYYGTWRVPENSLFVLGDNRNDSSDSHDWEYVPMQNVVGKALVVYWPPSAWGLIAHTNPVISP